jgi:drug/metabolite transporter (DMT)-like permease
VFFILPVFIWGDVGQLASLSWVGLGALAGAGVIHFILGRIAGYTGIRLIGANRAVPIFSSSLLIAALWGIFLLGEPLTLSLGMAILLIIGGIVLISTTGKETSKSVMPRGSLLKGVLLSLSAALFWGTSPVLVKIGLREINSPLVASFISYVTASIVIGFTLFYPANTEKLRRLNRSSLIPIIIAATAGAVAQLLRYQALVFSPVSQFEPIMAGANNLLVFPLSFLMNRQIEVFSLRIIVGAIAIVAGVFLIFGVA